MLLRGSRGADMKTTRINASAHASHVDHAVVAWKPIEIAISHRTRLMGASSIAGGALRGLVVAAGMVTVLGASPALAQCFSGGGSGLTTGGAGCDAVVPAGANATAVGQGANATGTNATAYGNAALANGQFATATGQSSTANGVHATATGSFANAI